MGELSKCWLVVLLVGQPGHVNSWKADFLGSFKGSSAKRHPKFDVSSSHEISTGQGLDTPKNQIAGRICPLHYFSMVCHHAHQELDCRFQFLLSYPIMISPSKELVFCSWYTSNPTEVFYGIHPKTIIFHDHAFFLYTYYAWPISHHMPSVITASPNQKPSIASPSSNEKACAPPVASCTQATRFGNWGLQLCNCLDIYVATCCYNMYPNMLLAIVTINIAIIRAIHPWNLQGLLLLWWLLLVHTC